MYFLFTLKLQEASDKYFFYVFIDGKQVYKLENNKPKEFRHVTVYGGDPWYEPAKAHIKNVIFKNEGKLFNQHQEKIISENFRNF